jgi:hypothetical protein
MRSKTKVLVCIAVVLCIVLSAGTAFAAPHKGGRHGGSHGSSRGSGTQSTIPQQTQCTYPHCPRITGEAGACINEGCQYYQNCPNEDCPRLAGGTCTNANCPFNGERSQDNNGSPAGNSRSTGSSSGSGNNGHRGGHHGRGRHH